MYLKYVKNVWKTVFYLTFKQKYVGLVSCWTRCKKIHQITSAIVGGEGRKIMNSKADGWLYSWSHKKIYSTLLASAMFCTSSNYS